MNPSRSPEEADKPLTPLQLILSDSANASKAQEATGRSRITVWRWREGLSKPLREDAAKLIETFQGLDYDGCYSAASAAIP